MKARQPFFLLLLCLLLVSLLCSCGQSDVQQEAPPVADSDGEEIMYPDNDKDFSTLRTPGSQESAYEYRTFFLPAVDGVSQPYVGDTMPYYEDGVYYIYYLKEAGDSINHSIYLATTTDFVTYTEQDEAVLEASRTGGQDLWIGTGSVVKVGDQYYFFYTGHGDGTVLEYQEKL